MKVLKNVQSGVMVLTLNHPASANALSQEICALILEYLQVAKNDDSIIAVAFTGAGKYFCSGMNLSSTSSNSFHDALTFFRTIHDFPKPTFSILNGPALGGGVGLFFCTDFRIAKDSAWIQLSEVRRGLIPAIISLFIVPQIGTSLSKMLFLTAEKVSAGRLYDLGIVYGVAEEHELESLIQKIVDMLTSGGPRALTECKRAIKFASVGDEHGIKDIFEYMITSKEAQYGEKSYVRNGMFFSEEEG